MHKHGNDNAFLRDSLHGTTPEPTYGGATSFMRRKYTRDLESFNSMQYTLARRNS